jgi:hypothetical protein
MKLTWENRSSRGKKPVPVSLCPPQIPHGLTRDRTHASVLIQRVTFGSSCRPSVLLFSDLTYIGM